LGCTTTAGFIDGCTEGAALDEAYSVTYVTYHIVAVLQVSVVCFSFAYCVQLTEDSHVLTDLGLDSLDHLELIMAIEDEFGKVD